MLKRVGAILMLMCMLCSLFCITAFADDTTSEDLVPDGAIVINSGEVLLNGNTYYIVWMPYLNYTESKVYGIQAVHQDGMTSSYCHVVVNYFNDSEFRKVTKWYGSSAAPDCLVSYYYGLDDPWDESYFDFPDVDATEIQKDTYYTISFTVPDDGKTYTLQEPNQTAMSRYPASVYTYSPCNHVYDNDCDANCNICNAERQPGEHAFDGNVCLNCGYEKPRHYLDDIPVVVNSLMSVAGKIVAFISSHALLLLFVACLPLVRYGSTFVLSLIKR